LIVEGEGRRLETTSLSGIGNSKWQFVRKRPPCVEINVVRNVTVKALK